MRGLTVLASRACQTAWLCLAWTLCLPALASPDYAWVDVTINQQPQGVMLVVAGEQPGQIWAPSSRVDELRLNPGRSQLVRLIEGESYTALHSLPDLRVAFDRHRGQLDLRIDPALLPLNRLGAERDHSRNIRRGHGVHLNYDLLATSLQSRELDTLSGFFEPVYFTTAGTLRNSLRASRERQTGADLLRLDTTWTTDLVAHTARLQLGDLLSAEDSFGRRSRMAGVRLAREFSITPQQPQFHIPTFYGISDVPSNVELFINGVRRAQMQTPPGPFSIDQAPIMTGSGSASLVLTNAQGEQQIQQIDYYVDPRLLRKGLLDYDLAVGWQRQSYGQQSFDYGQPGAVAALRYGLSNTATLEFDSRLAEIASHAEIRFRFRFLDWPLTATTGLGVQKNRSRPGNVLGRAGISLTQGPYFLNLQGLAVDARSGAVDSLPLTRQLIGGAGIRFGHWRFSYDLLHRRRFDDDRFTRQALRLTRSLRFAGGHLTLSAAVSETRDSVAPEQTGVQFSLAWSPNGRHHLAMRDSQQDGHRLDTSYSYRSEQDLGPRAQLQHQYRDQQHRLSASYQQSQPQWQWRARMDRLPDTDPSTQLGLRGALGVMRGHVFASRALGSAYAVVDLDGQAGIPVYMHHRIITRSGANGTAVIPQLLPYQRNAITTNPLDYALSVQPEDRELEVTPGANTGIYLQLDVRHAKGFELRLLQKPGIPVPSGAVIYGSSDDYRFFVGDNGESYLEQDAPTVDYQAYWADQSCRFSISLSQLGDGLQPHIGAVACR